MISLSIEVAGIEQLAAATERLSGPALMRQVGIALTRAAAKAKTAGIREFASHGVGRRIFGDDDSGARKLVKLSDMVVTDSTVQLTVTAKGFVAMQEIGGRTKPHIIKPRNAKVLAFAAVGAAGFGGDGVFVPYVRHPGATIAPHPALVPALQKVPLEVIRDVRAAIAALWQGKAA